MAWHQHVFAGSEMNNFEEFHGDKRLCLLKLHGSTHTQGYRPLLKAISHSNCMSAMKFTTTASALPHFDSKFEIVDGVSDGSCAQV